MENEKLTLQDKKTSKFVFINANPNHLDEVSLEQSLINSLAIAEQSEWQVIFTGLLNHAHEEGVLPDQKVCLRRLLWEHDFWEQAAYGSQIVTLDDFCEYMDQNCVNGEIAIVKIWSKVYKYSMVTVMREGKGNYHFFGIRNFNRCHVKAVWMKKPKEDDAHNNGSGDMTEKMIKKKGQAVTGGKKKEFTYHIPANHEYFHYYQANPIKRNTGDCVIRGMSYFMSCGWCEVMDKIAASDNYASVVLNVECVYEMLLKKEGYVKVKVSQKAGQKMDGKQLCEFMTKRNDGKAVLADVGNHIVAVMPMAQEDGKIRYKYVDTWDSSKKRVKCFYMKYTEDMEEDESITILGYKPRYFYQFQTGEKLRHPVFGKGKIKRVIWKDERHIIKVEFDGVVKELSGEWVVEHCKKIY